MSETPPEPSQSANESSRTGKWEAAGDDVFLDHIYQGLYGGLTASQIRARRGLKPAEYLTEHMGDEEMAAYLLCITQAESKVQKEGITEKEAACQAYYWVGNRVRQMIQELGSTLPEDLPHREQDWQ